MNALSFPISDPDMTDVLAAHKSDVSYDLNVSAIGIIQSFDMTKKTAQIQVVFKRLVPDQSSSSGQSLVSYPILIDCPVVTMQGGGAALQMPITAGDACLVIFADRNIDNWFLTGGQGLPPNERTHDLSDGIAIVGLNNLTSSLTNYSATEARLIYGGAKVGISGGLVTIQNQTTSLLTLINGLIDVIKALTVSGNPIDASGLAALTAQKVLNAGLFY